MNTLKMSDTPETDFHCWTDSSGEELIAVCEAEFCRRLERARDSLQTALEEISNLAKTLKTERDEAREAFVIATDQMVQAQCKLRETDKERQAFVIAQQEVITNLILERDKAMEALMKIEDLFIDGTDIYADRENMGMIAKAALEETK